ncbi:hypothetical protein ABPG74_018065 [Tetrahymena malaccensis]
MTNTLIFEQLKQHENWSSILDICLQVILKEKNNQTDFSQVKNNLQRQDKVLATKLIKCLKELAACSKSALKENLENIGSISADIKNYLYEHILSNIYMSRQLNNYQLIKYHFDPKKSLASDSQVVETRKSNCHDINSFIFDLAKIEWKVEVSLSSIKMKKILRPAVLLTFHTKQGTTKTFYLDIYQFQELRKNLALVMRQIHQIELK